MNREELDALFALQAAFPGMGKFYDGEREVLTIVISLTDEQAQFWEQAQQMMAPQHTTKEE